MKTCIVLNTKLRMAANNELEKYLFKVMNNSVFGKTLENITNYKEASGKPKKICQVCDEAKLLRRIFKVNETV